MGSSQRQMFLRAQTPGPGSYELGHDAHRGITISGYKNKQVLELTPGPGSYEYLDDIKRRPCSAKYILLTQNRQESSNRSLWQQQHPRSRTILLQII